ncbi:homeobox protein cut-like 1 [Chanos chanos]|uniref:Homeobox protein cut-like n=1 Tax=Chanos chanos TaxID=29144 RepID=A0A6J2W580_CHACN|nr:homeobox protein cut-like 1 [Chanos chanos]
MAARPFQIINHGLRENSGTNQSLRYGENECAGPKLVMALAKREKEILYLQEEVQRLQHALQEVQESTANQIRHLEWELASKTEAIEKFEVKLQSQQDYEQIKAELRTLRELRQASTPADLSEVCAVSETTLKDGHVLPLSYWSSAGSSPSPCVEDIDIKREAETPVRISSLVKTEDLQDNHSSLSPGLPADHGATSTPTRQFDAPFQVSSVTLLSPSIKTEDKTTEFLPVAPSDETSAGPEDGEYGAEGVTSACWEGVALGGAEEDQRVETAEIIRQVKEQLQKHKIGQRVFGHYVLGMSQGSVSEILAKPKPWSGLSVKGKEVFLRMKRFLSDERNSLAVRDIQVRQRRNVKPCVRTPDVGSDDAIKNILEKAKEEIQSQREDEGACSQNGQCCEVGHEGDDAGCVGRGSSEDVIKGILEQARQEMEGQQEGDARKWCTSHDSSPLRSDSQSAQEKRAQLQCVRPSTVSPTDFVQNIICQVKRELAKDSTNGSPGPVSPSPPSTTSSACSTDQGMCLPVPAVSTHLDRVTSPSREEPVLLVQVKEEEEWEGDEAHEVPQCQTSMRPMAHPLTPDQYERLINCQLNTAELTKQVKAKLAQNGIFQRVFGEKVLGLSQASVSDMLSRPKPWSKLTQRDRELFVRMQLWLLDQQGQDLGPPPSHSPQPKDNLQSRAYFPVERTDQTLESFKENQPPALAQDVLPNPGSLCASTPELHSGLDIQQLAVCWSELDTHSITKRVKEVLRENNLGQRLFGEMVLGLTQGSVSDLLAWPKPWSKLSLKGREPFVRMQLWLNDPQNVQKLNNVKKIKERACLKRHVSVLRAESVRDHSGGPSDTLGPGSPSLNPSMSETSKRPRVVLTALEKEALKRTYQVEPYPSQNTIEKLASQLGLRTSTVSNWFYNYRARTRQDVRSRPLEAESRTLVHSKPQEMSARSFGPSTLYNSQPTSKDIDWVIIKQESSDLETEEDEELDRIIQPIRYVSTGVQHRNELKTEEGEEIRLQQGCDQINGEGWQKTGQESRTQSANGREDQASRVSKANLESRSPSPGFGPSVIPPCVVSMERQTSVEDHIPAHCMQKSSLKMANLDSIIHRLEQTADPEGALEWVF